MLVRYYLKCDKAEDLVDGDTSEVEDTWSPAVQDMMSIENDFIISNSVTKDSHPIARFDKIILALQNSMNFFCFIFNDIAHYNSL